MRRRAASLVGSRLRCLVGDQQAALSSTPVSLLGINSKLPIAPSRAAKAGSQARSVAALPAVAAAVAHPQASRALPLTRTDEFGAISIVEGQEELDFVPSTFENVDGRRIEDGRYAAFTKDVSGAAAAATACVGGSDGCCPRPVGRTPLLF